MKGSQEPFDVPASHANKWLIDPYGIDNGKSWLA